MVPIMSLKNTTTLASTQSKPSAWQKQDTVWMLSLYGTAIGAGVLFLPIDVGLHGAWPLIIMMILAFPMTYFSHLALCRFVLSGSAKHDITDVVDEHFGSFAGKILTLLYFCSIYPILLMYSVAITNTANSFIVHQLGMTAPSRPLLAITLILALMAVIRFGQETIVKSMSILVYPFISVLILLSLYLIPYWNGGIFLPNTQAASTNSHSLLMTLWLVIPVMVFSFNHSPIISSFAVNQKERYGEQAEGRSAWILKYSHFMMVGTVLFFVMSCVLCLSSTDLAQAKQQNISILSFLANHFQTPMIAYVAPFIAFIAISKSFLGHYLGASEGIHGLMLKYLRASRKEVSDKYLYYIIDIFMILTCWLIATLNPSILGIIETLIGPVIATILFIMPMYAIARIPAMQKYRGAKLSNLFITMIGLVAISAILYGVVQRFY